MRPSGQTSIPELRWKASGRAAKLNNTSSRLACMSDRERYLKDYMGCHPHHVFTGSGLAGYLLSQQLATLDLDESKTRLNALVS